MQTEAEFDTEEYYDGIAGKPVRIYKNIAGFCNYHKCDNLLKRSHKTHTNIAQPRLEQIHRFCSRECRDQWTHFIKTSLIIEKVARNREEEKLLRMWVLELNLKIEVYKGREHIVKSGPMWDEFLSRLAFLH